MLWVGTISNGLDKFDCEKGVFTRYKYEKSNLSGLSDNIIYGIFEDNELSVSDLIQENKKLNLTSNDIKYLTPYCLSLKEFSVYEFSDLMEIVKNIDSKGNSNLKLWKRQLENAISICNEKKYSELINLNNDE